MSAISFAVDQGGVEIAAQCGQVALLPVADEVAVQGGGPRHAALEKGEVHLREPLRDAAEEEGLGQGLLAVGQHGDVVVRRSSRSTGTASDR